MMSPARYSKKCNEYLALRRSSTTACKAVALNRFRDLLTVDLGTNSYTLLSNSPSSSFYTRRLLFHADVPIRRRPAPARRGAQRHLRPYEAGTAGRPGSLDQVIGSTQQN